MKNQDFRRSLALIVLFSLGFQLWTVNAVKPPAVKSGSKVGLISPASPIQNSTKYTLHITETMNQLNLLVEFGAHSFEKYGFLAGTDSNRAADVLAMFADPSISAVIANRGGWGCNRIINLLNYTTIATNPKVIMGFSDLTGLLNAITTQTGMVTFHGPVGANDWSGLSNLTYQYWNQLIETPSPTVRYSNPEEYSNMTWTITPGKAKGRLIGGNLSIFTAMIGSHFLPSTFQNTILFLESVHTQPLEFDMLLTNLQLAGILSQISGFVFGTCSDCEPSDPENTLTLTQILMDKIQPYNIPAFAGAMIGHDLAAQFILPIGAKVAIDADAFTIDVLEPVVLSEVGLGIPSSQGLAWMVYVHYSEFPVLNNLLGWCMYTQVLFRTHFAS